MTTEARPADVRRDADLAMGDTLDLGGRVVQRNVLERMFGSEHARDSVALGRYRVIGTLGHGAFGAVYVADDPRLGRRVAIKVFFDGQTQSRRVEREAQALATLSHPNVVTVHDVGVDTSRGYPRVYMVMEYLEGTSIASWLQQSQPSSAQVLDAFVRAGRGLAAAHEAGLLHRDFKPANVVISRGRVKVVDFGLARARDEGALESADTPTRVDMPIALSEDITREGSIVGTPAFLSPECARGRAATARSDQFGFAASLYFALSGQSVYATLDTTDAAPSLDPQRLAQGLHDLPARTRQALLRALRLEPHQRFESMEALLAELSARRPRWILPSVAAVGLTGSLAWLMLGDPAPCPGDDFEPWTAADVRALSQASGKDPSSARDVNDAIDGFGRDHARLYALRAAACEAARRDPTAEHLEQAACVERQWSAYREVRAALMGSAPPQSTTITTQIDALAPPDSCRRTSPDRSPTIPSHEEIGGPIEALIDDGRIDEALDAIDAHQDTATPSRRAILQRLRGTAYTFAGRDAAARNAFRRAMAQADSLPDDTVAATVLLGVARGTLLVDGDVEAATLLRERAHARMPLDTMGPALRRADDELAVFLALRAGRIGEVVERLSPLLDRADDELPHHSKTVVDFASLAAAATRQRSNDIAAAAAERCVEFPGERNVTALAAVADCRLTLARLASDQGDWTRVVDQVHAAFGLASTPRMGSVLTARIHHRGADLLARAGRHDAAVTAYERAIEDSKSEDGRHTRVSAASLADLGRVHERAGDLDLAETAMRQSAAVSAVLAPDTYDHALTMAMLGHVLSAKGEPEAAVVAYDQSLACKDAQHDERLSANIRLVRAIAVSAAGDTVDCPQVRADLALMPAEDSPDYVLVAALAERCADAED